MVRSFNHTFERLNNVSYLKDEMLPFVDPITKRPSRNCAAAMLIKTKKIYIYSLSEMFSCELKFVIDLLKKWLAEKFFNSYKEIDMLTKQRLKRQSPIFLPTADSNFPSEKIVGFLDFVIEKEHSFIRNIFDPEDLTLSKNIETLEKYDASFKKCSELLCY